MGKPKKQQQQKPQQKGGKENVQEERPLTAQEKRDREYALKLQSEANNEDSTPVVVDDGWESVGPKGKAQKKQQRKAQREHEEERMKEIAKQRKLAEEKARKEEQARLEAERKKAEERKRKEEERKRKQEEQKRQEEEMKRREEEQKEIEKGDHEMALELQREMEEEEKRMEEKRIAADEADGWTFAGAKGKKRARQKKAAVHKEEVKAEKVERHKALIEQQKKQDPQEKANKKAEKKAKKEKLAEEEKEKEKEKEVSTEANESNENNETSESTENNEKCEEQTFGSWAEAVKTRGKCVSYKGVGSVESKAAEDEADESDDPFSTECILQPCGFTNRGNKCYFNSVMQVLLSTPLFREMIGKVRASKKDVANPQDFARIPLLLEFIDFIRSFPTFKVSTFAGNTFVPAASKTPSDLKDLQRYILPDFLRGVGGSAALVKALENEQQDAQELFSYILDTLHEELLVLDEITKPKTEEVENTEEEEDGENGDDGEWMTKAGKKTVVIRTQESSFRSTMVDEIFSGHIKSHLDNKETGKTSVNDQPFYTLQLDINTDKVRSIEDALSLYQAPELIEGDVKMFKRSVIENPPRVLVLHLKRFVFTDKPFPVKCSKPIVFNETLGLAGEGYVLSGVIRHHGATAIKGHYTCDVRCVNNLWMHCNDTHIEWYESVKEVLEQNQDTYMLFYTRKQKKIIKLNITRKAGI